ncbi:MAG: Helix-turn-helix domain [Paenibacillus sp.]|jgi:AraC-like DNA-binding protein|nr:Helix-turn-helix domain [Paenibacillus sp.]
MLTTYLERKRMERALELLSGTDIAIKDIASMVGYGSSNTFGRAFKRVYGTNATGYSHGRKARSNQTQSYRGRIILIAGEACRERSHSNREQKT